MQTNFLQVLDAASLPASKIFPVPEIITLMQKWMQSYMQQDCIQVLDANNVFASIGCSIIACIPSVSSPCNYRIYALIDAGIYAVKLSASIGCRKIASSIGYSIIVLR